MTFSETQQVSLAIVPRITAVPTIFGSGYIVQNVVRNPQKRGLLYHRILLLMSLMDLVSGIRSFIGTWPVPKGTPGSYGAIGTTQTCTAHGSFGHGSFLSSSLYNGSLATYYVLSIAYGWSETRCKRVEPCLHAIPLLIGWGTAIAALPLTLFNSIVYSCWIAGLPAGCGKEGQEQVCIRGENASIYRWAFYHAFVWSNFVFLSACMCLVYRAVLKTERRTERYRYVQEGQNRRKRRKSREVAFQALLYVFAYYGTWIWNPINYIYIEFNGRPYFPTYLMQTCINPMSGFFNSIIYLRPKYKKFRKKYPEKSLCQILRMLFSNSPVGRASRLAASRLRSRGSQQAEAAAAEAAAAAEQTISERQRKRSTEMIKVVEL